MSLPKQGGLLSLMLAWLPAHRGEPAGRIAPQSLAPPPLPQDPPADEFAVIKEVCAQINEHFENAFGAVPALGRKELADKAVLHPLIVAHGSDMEIHMMKDGNLGRYVALNIRITRSESFDNATQRMASQYSMLINTKDNASPQPLSFCPGEVDKMEEAIMEAIWNKLSEAQQERLNHSTWPYPYFQGAAAAPPGP